VARREQHERHGTLLCVGAGCLNTHCAYFTANLIRDRPASKLWQRTPATSKATKTNHEAMLQHDTQSGKPWFDPEGLGGVALIMLWAQPEMTMSLKFDANAPSS